jgi:peroxiredoxin family protein
MQDVHVTITALKHIEKSELDFVLHGEFGFTSEHSDSDYEFHTIEKNSPSLVADELKIETLENLIEDFKRLGATHIRILTHEDHHGYEFEALKLELSTPEEIKKYKKYYDSIRQYHREVEALQRKFYADRSELSKKLNPIY